MFPRTTASGGAGGEQLGRVANRNAAALRYCPPSFRAHSSVIVPRVCVLSVLLLHPQGTLLLNLAACWVKMDNFDQVLKCAQDALALNPTNPKALYRRAMVRHTGALRQTQL